jgi:prepilin-type N-terminal cleavage/methylation domain-containing protein
MQKQSGFTILELIIVIALLSIIAAVGIPNYLNWLPDIRLKSAARNLKSDLMLAQQRAIRENASVAIVFSPGSNSYDIFLDNSTVAGEANNWFRDASEETMKTESMPSNVAMDLAAFGLGPDPRVRFNGRGLPNVSGEVRLSNTKNIIRRITLSITGRATIEISADGGGTWSDAE